MKTWQFWVIVLVFVFVVIPLIYFAVVAKSVATIASSDKPAEPTFGINPAKKV